MSLFFNLLPADVSKDIFYDWLDPLDGGRGLLRALSALDIASSKHHQSALRSLIRQLPPFGKHSSKYKPSAFTQHTVNIVLWLCSRKVPIRSLYLSTSGHHTPGVLEQRRFCLPTVNSIHWSGPNDIILGAAALLRCCPNVTSIGCSNFVGFALAIDTSDIPNLKILALNGPRNAISSLNTFCGPGLQELRISNFHLPDQQMPVLGDIMCPHLRVLEAAVSRGRFKEFLQLLLSLKFLTELTVRLQRLMFSEVYEIVALPNITSLSIQTDNGYDGDSACFAHVLMLRSHWKCIQIAGCKYVPSEGLLQLSGSNDASIVTTILDICTSVNTLVVSDLCDVGVARLIGRMLGKRLKALEVSSPMSSAVSALLVGCDSDLSRLSLDGMGAEGQLQLVATRCGQLEYLSVGASVRRVTASELTAVFSGCPLLKELVIISRLENPVKALQAIFDKRIVLHRLELNGFSEVDWFRQQIKYSQLLPMPEFVLTNERVTGQH